MELGLDSHKVPPGGRWSGEILGTQIEAIPFGERIEAIVGGLVESISGPQPHAAHNFTEPGFLERLLFPLVISKCLKISFQIDLGSGDDACVAVAKDLGRRCVREISDDLGIVGDGHVTATAWSSNVEATGARPMTFARDGARRASGALPS